MSPQPPLSADPDLKNVINEKVEKLRPRLLDLSRRNPLISTPLGSRYGSYVRVVDELPDVLFFRLSKGDRFRFNALPEPEDEPEDEHTDQFRSELNWAMQEDEEYAAAVSQIDQGDREAPSKEAKAERELRDRLRQRLNMPERVTREGLSLPDHARAHGISPLYELPTPADEHEDGRHADDEIQTLLLPDVMARTLNRVRVNCRTWQQETGLNVMQAAFGYLEWTDPDSKRRSYSPLILLPVELDKVGSSQGARFSVTGAGEDPMLNNVLVEKLRREHDVELPSYDGGSVEEYLAGLAGHLPPRLSARARRFVTFGAFPSAQMAMYHDLDTRRRDFAANDVVRHLLGGGGAAAGVSPFADEYDGDDPYVEKRVPLLVSDADSSQFSALVDVADGKNLAVEGPPGTGKSQTIVNAIAMALSQGKKVLFVAEKAAALQVVQARLEHLGLGEFVLPLLASASSRQQVLDSVRKRLDMDIGPDAHEHETNMAGFRDARRRLNEYIEILTEDFAGSGFTVHEILGSALNFESSVETLELPEVDAAFAAGYDRARIEEVIAAVTSLVDASKSAEANASGWAGLKNGQVDRFTADEALRLAGDAAQLCAQAGHLRDRLQELGAPRELTAEETAQLSTALSRLLHKLPAADAALTTRLVREDHTAALRELLERCRVVQTLRDQISESLLGPFDDALSHELRQLHATCRDCGIDTLDRATLTASREALAKALRGGEQASKLLELLCRESPEFADWKLSVLSAAGEIVRRVPREALLLRGDPQVTADPKAAQILTRGAQLLGQLRIERESMNDLFNLDQPIDAAQLHADAETLSAAGVFAGLSGRFREAKRRWRTLSRRRRSFDKAAAADELKRLVAWKQRVTQFNEDAQLHGILGVGFRGLDTDLEALGALGEYLGEVEDRFPALELRGLRTMLKTAHVDVLTTVAELDVASFECAHAGLDAELERRHAQLRAWDAGMMQVEQASSRIKRPETVSPDQLATLSDLVDDHNTATAAIAVDPLQEVLGDRFRGVDAQFSDFAAEIAAAETLENVAQWGEFYCGLIERRQVEETRDATAADPASAAETATTTLAESVGLPRESLKPQESYEVRAEQYARLADDRSGFVQHSVAHAASEKVRSLGFGAEIDAVKTRSRDVGELPQVIRARIFRSLARQVYDRHGTRLAEFKHEGLDILRQRLANLDRKIIEGSRRKLRRKLSRATPPAGVGVGRKSDYTEFALISHELGKSKRHIPTRALTRRAGQALLDLKPCWMMSPLAAAQYVDGDDIQFDLCVVDEASQMTPENAVGAVARSRQAMIVGDTNQLPPSNFFRNMVADDDDDEEDVVEESVLELANSAFRPARRLRWHYRSRHSSLIAFSNRTVYDDDLIVFPAAEEHRAKMGVSLREVEGVYTSGKNPIEAEEMVKAIVQFMHREPERSLGVVTLNKKQRDLVRDKFDQALNKDPRASAYVEKWKAHRDGLESFFVKNLENVQGDERDVIFIGTVYGPSQAGGKVYQRFGPINGVAGKRRLNVLFSRAKEQIVTFSSMTSADISAEAGGNAGAYMLKCWLEYSKTGRLDAGESHGREPDSELEEYVAAQIRSMGCEAVPQVGVSGYFIDIGVKHPQWPHGYLLGVECDGATYHSSRSARDRDRLRQEILEQLGWSLHRVWSTNWFDDPAAEAEKLRRAIAARLEEVKQLPEQVETKLPETEVEQVVASGCEEAPAEPAEPEAKAVMSAVAPISRTPCVKIGSWVRVRYLDGDRGVTEGVLSDGRVQHEGSPSIRITSPLGEAISRAEEGEEVSMLVDSQYRRILIEEVRQ